MTAKNPSSMPLLFTCALLTDNSVKCWGYNGSGQMGVGDTTNRLTPTTVPGISAVQIEAGYNHVCALLTNGSVKCWGYNSNGELGTGLTSYQTTPTSPSGLGSNVKQIAAGQMHTCALLQGGQIVCWGQNGNGQLGLGDTTSRYVPTLLSNISANYIACGAGHTCAILTDGSLNCWGANYGGQLGIGTTTDTKIPTPVP